MKRSIYRMLLLFMETILQKWLLKIKVYHSLNKGKNWRNGYPKDKLFLLEPVLHKNLSL